MKKHFILIAVILLISACGGGGTSQPEDPKGVMEAFSKAIYDGQWEQAEALATEESKIVVQMVKNFPQMPLKSSHSPFRL